MKNDGKLAETPTSVALGRISTSQSGFTTGEFVLVFKNGDGSYSQPRKIPREIALATALDFAANREAAKKYDLSPALAKFIFEKAQKVGLVSQTTDRESSLALETGITRVPAAAESAVSAPNRVGAVEQPAMVIERQPRYFPRIDPYRKPELPSATIEVVAFVLSGVAPNQLEDPRVIQRTLGLRQLVQTSASRISPGLLMQDDHWHVLAHLHAMDQSTFKLAWEDAQMHSTGQANTDVVKLMGRLEKFKIDPLAKSLEASENADFFVDLREISLELLSRIFRRIRRKIETFHEQPLAMPRPQGWLGRLASIGRPAPDPLSSSPVPPEVLSYAKEYLKQSIKIGRILRSEVLKNHR